MTVSYEYQVEYDEQLFKKGGKIKRKTRQDLCEWRKLRRKQTLKQNKQKYLFTDGKQKTQNSPIGESLNKRKDKR